jgi:hypothetical protein
MKMKLTARLMARVHLALALVWAVLTIPTLLWWKNSILWVSLMSIYAIVISSPLYSPCRKGGQPTMKVVKRIKK